MFEAQDTKLEDLEQRPGCVLTLCLNQTRSCVPVRFVGVQPPSKCSYNFDML